MREEIRKIQALMERAAYVTDPAIGTAVHLAMTLGKPLLVEGHAGQDRRGRARREGARRVVHRGGRREGRGRHLLQRGSAGVGRVQAAPDARLRAPGDRSGRGARPEVVGAGPDR